MKTLHDIKADMSTLYDELHSGAVKREEADSMANIAGKFLKAHQLELAEQVFLQQLRQYETKVLPGAPSNKGES